MRIGRFNRKFLAAFGAAAMTAGVATAVASGGSAAGAATACAPAKLIVARGTFEFGTLGFIVGDTLISSLNKKAPGKFASEAVDYPANIDAQSPVQGNQAVVKQVNAAIAACPNQKIVLSGYSQGAQIVDEALGIDMTGTINGGPPTAVLSADALTHIAAIVQFGNPLGSVGKTVAGTAPSMADRTKEYCADGDPVCHQNQINFFAHLFYFQQTDAAADFVLTKV